MKFKKAAAVLLSFLIMTFNINVYGRSISTYDYLRNMNSDFLLRLSEYGVANARINEFLTALDNEADDLTIPEDRNTLEEYFLFILFNVVLADESYADVCGAFDIVFQEEMIYMMENNMELPPVLDEVFMSVMYDLIKPPTPPLDEGGYEEFIPEEEYIPPEETVKPEPEPEPEPVFLDIGDAKWASEHILSLYDKGIIEGYDGKIFRPLNNVTRAELAKIVCNSFLSKRYAMIKSGYSDVFEGLWYYDYVKICEYYSIFDDILTDTFNGDEYVTRQEMCTVVYRAFLNSGRTMKESTKSEFPDMAELSAYAVEAVSKLQAFGVVNGMEDYCFHPFYKTTRAELCKVINILISD